jgi:hypothetical protein
MTARATAILDDRDPQLTFTPQHGWSQQYIPDDCRGVDGGEEFIARVTDFTRGGESGDSFLSSSELTENADDGVGTWTTATAQTGTSNITMEFRGTDVYAWFMLFTRIPVGGESDPSIPP